MTISNIDVDTALRVADVESLIATGAPGDEYSLEAKEIAAALASLDNATEANIIAVVALVWAKHFNLSSQDIAKRMHAFQQIAHRLL